MSIKTLREVCEVTGTSRKALQLYDGIGLLQPTEKGKEGRKEWLYDEMAISRLRIIMLLKEADFKLEEIKTALQGVEVDLIGVYEEAIARLEQKRARIQGGINYFKHAIEGLKYLDGIPGLEDIDNSKLQKEGVSWKETLDGSFTVFAAIGEPDDEDAGMSVVMLYLWYMIGQYRDEGQDAKQVQSIFRVIHGIANKYENRELTAEEFADQMLEGLNELRGEPDAFEIVLELVGSDPIEFLGKALDYYVNKNGGSQNV